MNNDFSSVLIKKSLLDVEDYNNTFSEEAKRKKSKKRAKEQSDEDYVQDDEFISAIKNGKKSKTKTVYEENVINKDFDDDARQKTKIINKEMEKQANKSLLYSSNFVNGNDKEAEAYLKKINCTGALSMNVDVEEPAKSNRKEFCREPSSSRRKSISSNVEYSRSITKILSDFENKNESLKRVCCEDSYINSLHSNSSVFIVQIPINLNPIELVGKEISFLKKKKIKTDNEKYISTLSHVVEPVVLTTNSQCIRLHPTCVVTLERDCKIEDSETFNVPDFANNLGVNVIDPARLTRKNPIIGLEKEECERVLSSSVESKLKAAEKMYRKYKKKKIKKSSTQDDIKQENIKDEEIFKYLSQPSLVI